jgi:hypothetical protein
MSESIVELLEGLFEPLIKDILKQNRLVDCGGITAVTCPNGCCLAFLNDSEDVLAVRARPKGSSEWLVRGRLKGGGHINHELAENQRGEWEMEVIRPKLTAGALLSLELKVVVSLDDLEQHRIDLLETVNKTCDEAKEEMKKLQSSEKERKVEKTTFTVPTKSN